jgi:hypothetical protein
LTVLPPSLGRALLLVLFFSAPVSAQFFNDRPARQGRQPAFGMFGFPNQPQQAPFGGFGEPQVHNRESPGLSRSRRPHRVVRRPQPRVDYAHAPAPEQQEASPQQRILVIGDGMADWLGYGLEQLLADQPEFGVTRRINTDSGLLKYQAKKGEPANWVAAAKQIVAAEKADAVVVMLGVNDRIAIRESASTAAAAKPIGETDKARAPGEDQDADDVESPTDGKGLAGNGTSEFRDERWIASYSRAIRQMTAALRERGVPVIWVGLPALQGQQPTSDMLFLDALFREGAARAGVTYVDVWEGFVDEAGRFVQYGPDFEGQIRRLRTPDGVFFTKPGARKLAHYVVREIRRLLAVKAPSVALPVETSPSAADVKPQSRPLAGPVIPLVAPVVGTAELLGGGGASRPVAADALVTRTLVMGAPLSAPAGRADDYSWPRREIGSDPAKDTPMASSTPAKPAEPVTVGQTASRNAQRQ